MGWMLISAEASLRLVVVMFVSGSIGVAALLAMDISVFSGGDEQLPSSTSRNNGTNIFGIMFNRTVSVAGYFDASAFLACCMA